MSDIQEINKATEEMLLQIIAKRKNMEQEKMTIDLGNSFEEVSIKEEELKHLFPPTEIKIKKGFNVEKILKLMSDPKVKKSIDYVKTNPSIIKKSLLTVATFTTIGIVSSIYFLVKIILFIF